MTIEHEAETALNYITKEGYTLRAPIEHGTYHLFKATGTHLSNIEIRQRAAELLISTGRIKHIGIEPHFRNYHQYA